MTIKYDQLSEILFETFPEIKAMYLEEKEWYEDLTHLPHIIFGELLTPLLIELLTENKNKTEISKIFNFIENIANEEDNHIQEVVQTTVLERIGDDKRILFTSYKYMGNKTRQLSDAIEKSLGRF